MKRKEFLKALALTPAALALTACGDKPAAGSQPASTPGSTAGSTAAVEWPSAKTVYVDVPARAGGGSDMMARYVTTGLEEILPGVSFVVTNYDTSEVGAQHAAHAKPDGLNLTVASGANMSNWLTGTSQVNPKTDLTMLGKVHAGGPQAWICAPDAPYNTFLELVDYIRANPGKLNIGCGLGSTSQMLWIAMFNSIDPALNDMVNYVQAASEPDKLTGVAGGAVDLANCSINNAYAYQQDGRVKLLGTLGPSASNLASISELVGKDLDQGFCSMKEAGVDFVWESGFYVMGPAGMDPALVEAINTELQGLANSKVFTDGMKSMAVFVDVCNLEDSQAAFDAEWQTTADLLTALGMNAKG